MDSNAPYTLYKADFSYFSGKLEAYLRYKDIPHEAVDVDIRVMNGEIYPSTGTRKVPAVRTADGEWLFDTTPMIQWFEKRYPDNPVLPDDPALRFLALLLEDYGDEWLWRPSMWWRWMYRGSERAAGWRIGSLFRGPGFVTWLLALHYAHRQKKEWLFKDGVNKSNQYQVRDLYLHELDFLQATFEVQPYLLGSHPSVADYGYYGSMFRHFGNDPESSEVMRRRAPAVYEWTARLWNETPTRLASSMHWQWPDAEHWQPTLERIATDYLPYLHQNAVAWQAGQKRFDFTGNSLNFAQTVTTDYRVWCRQNLQRSFAELTDSDQQRLHDLFANAGGLAALQADGVIDAQMDSEYALPRPAKALKPFKTSWLKLLFGQARN